MVIPKLLKNLKEFDLRQEVPLTGDFIYGGESIFKVKKIIHTPLSVVLCSVKKNGEEEKTLDGLFTLKNLSNDSYKGYRAKVTNWQEHMKRCKK